jgi:hypothetical protein
MITVKAALMGLKEGDFHKCLQVWQRHLILHIDLEGDNMV